MEKKKITQQEYFDFLKEFPMHTEYQRFGQAFCNKFNIKDDYLFYLIDATLVSQYIADNYVNFEG